MTADGTRLVTLVTLAWTAPLGGPPVTGYRIFAGTEPGLVNEYTSPVIAATSFQVQDDIVPRRYFVVVRAVNECGISSASNQVEVVVPTSW